MNVPDLVQAREPDGRVRRLVGRVLRAVADRVSAAPAPPQAAASSLDSGLPFDGYLEGRTPTPIVDRLPDEDLRRLNALLPWSCFTVDARGRRFGDRAWSGKRSVPQLVPDPRIVALDARFPLAGRRVLEVGCFEGVHTVGLCGLGAQVTAVDARIENVVKTVTRAAMFGHRPVTLVCDVERAEDLALLPEVDLIHHVGVLYHLEDPVTHLEALAARCREALLLDTHIAVDATADRTYEVGGRSYRHRLHQERGKADVFSGMRARSRWLLLDDLRGLLARVGFSAVEVLEERAERNGPRVALLARR